MQKMTRAEIEKRLIEIVRKEKKLPEDLLQPGSELAAMGIDSLDALTILFEIEEEFHVSIPETAARTMKTVNDMVDAVMTQVGTEG